MYNVVCFLAREPGWRCLQALHSDPDFKIKLLYSHLRKPSSEDPLRSERKNYERFKRFALENKIPFYVKDTFKSAADLKELNDAGPIDFMVSCNWKFKIPLPDLQRAKLGTVNLHRGKLPEYRGLEPVKRALLDGWKHIYLSAHMMEAEYDTGHLLDQAVMSVTRRENESLDDTVERLKTELYPYYPQSMIKGLNKLKPSVKPFGQGS